ncbi:hypothetical protein GJ632_12420, partial [Halogeometricum sp. CBA1124]|nr:hypothetical protein [Halogeometricum sp. CBA1124]
MSSTPSNAPADAAETQRGGETKSPAVGEFARPHVGGGAEETGEHERVVV